MSPFAIDISQSLRRKQAEYHLSLYLARHQLQSSDDTRIIIKNPLQNSNHVILDQAIESVDRLLIPISSRYAHHPPPQDLSHTKEIHASESRNQRPMIQQKKPLEDQADAQGNIYAHLAQHRARNLDEANLEGVTEADTSSTEESDSEDNSSGEDEEDLMFQSDEDEDDLMFQIDL